MNTYIRERLRADAGHLVARAKAEEVVIHKGLRGRFRELLVDSLLTPWLPPYAGCGTGMIVDMYDRSRDSTQEDIVVFDRSLVPAVMAHPSALEGVFPIDGVLVRVEVKSKLTRTELRSAVLAAKEMYEMGFIGNRVSILPISAVFAFSSDLQNDSIQELERLLSVVNECGLHYQSPCQGIPGPIGALCVVGRGHWSYGRTTLGESAWHQAKMRSPYDEILDFIGAISNTCFNVHADREGRNVSASQRGAGGGIGNFILSSDTYEKAPVQRPTEATRG